MPCQQYALYESEGTVPRGRDLDLDGVREFVDRLRDEDWFRERFPMVDYVEVGGRGGRGDSVGGWFPDAGAGRIEMADGHLCELYVCHELAHVLAAARYGNGSHSPWFARIYATLVFLGMGSAAYAKLAAAFDRDGIDWDVDI